MICQSGPSKRASVSRWRSLIDLESELPECPSPTHREQGSRYREGLRGEGCLHELPLRPTSSYGSTRELQRKTVTVASFGQGRSRIEVPGEIRGTLVPVVGVCTCPEVAIHPGDGDHLVCREVKIKQQGIFQHPLGTNRLRDDAVTPLNMPPQHDLRHGFFMRPCYL